MHRNAYGEKPHHFRGKTPLHPELETRETEAGVRYGRGEADLGAQRRDHEGPRVEHGALERAPSERH